MSSLYAPDTEAIYTALVAYLLAAQYTIPLLAGQYVYVQPSGQFPNGGVQAGMFKDQIGDLLPEGSPNIIAEVWGADDDSRRASTGGTMEDTQSFHMVSLTDMSDGNAAELRLARARDAILPSFAKSVRLGNAGNIVVARYKPGSGSWDKVYRRATEYRAHIFEISVVSRWVAQGGFTA